MDNDDEIDLSSSILDNLHALVSPAKILPSCVNEIKSFCLCSFQMWGSPLRKRGMVSLELTSKDMENPRACVVTYLHFPKWLTIVVCSSKLYGVRKHDNVVDGSLHPTQYTRGIFEGIYCGPNSS